MDANDTAFSGSIPELYDSFLVPLIFAPYALDLAERIAAAGARDVLETAAGTGVLTRALAARLAPDARIVATDLNQAMLDIAASRQPPDNRIAWRQADAQSLPFADRSQDVVVCQFGVMFFPDRIKAYGEARRVLRPGGSFLFTVWDGLAENDFPRLVEETMAQRFSADPPRFLGRTPYAYHDAGTIRGELAAAGFTAISIEPRPETSPAPSPRHAAVAFCQGTPLRAEILARDPTGLDAATQQADDALERRFGSGAIEGRIKAYLIAAS
ncbi:MAG TPA: class I SAM-dependent methyltransferase [Stellaceae bacterium]|nr:class I SAM-dependent methyltransferase [Stellaceae bacterium]